MSFDNTFDYSNVAVFVDLNIRRSDKQISELTKNTNEISSLAASDATIAKKVSKNKAEIRALARFRGKLQEVKAEITAIQALSESDKSALLTYQQLSGESADVFMKRMVFNHAAILKNNGLKSLVADKSVLSARTLMAKEQIKTHEMSNLAKWIVKPKATSKFKDGIDKMVAKK